jgi:hypothetical protein
MTLILLDMSHGPQLKQTPGFALYYVTLWNFQAINNLKYFLSEGVLNCSE